MNVFIHIPKTGGTSLGDMIDYSTRRKVFWDYPVDYSLEPAPPDYIKSNVEFLESHYKFIFGHFSVKKYHDLFENVNFYSCIRHPVDRIISHYNHVACLEIEEDFRSSDIRNGTMDVVDFAKTDENIINASYMHLNGIKPNKFSYVFINERMTQGLEIFKRISGIHPIYKPRVINNKEQRKFKGNIIPVNNKAKQKVYELATLDVELYKEFVYLHEQKLENI